MNRGAIDEFEQMIDDGLDAARGIFWWAVVPLLCGIAVIAWLWRPW